VLRFLDHLVVQVAELGRAVRQGRRVLEQAALQRALELHAVLHEGRDHVQADARAHGFGLRAVPGGSAERVGLGQREARIVVVDRVVGIVPGHVDVRLGSVW